MTIRVIDGASEQERSRCIHALVLAFVRDPMMRWLFPEPEAYLTPLLRELRDHGAPMDRQVSA